MIATVLKIDCTNSAASSDSSIRGAALLKAGEGFVLVMSTPVHH